MQFSHFWLQFGPKKPPLHSVTKKRYVFKFIIINLSIKREYSTRTRTYYIVLRTTSPFVRTHKYIICNKNKPNLIDHYNYYTICSSILFKKCSERSCHADVSFGLINKLSNLYTVNRKWKHSMLSNTVLMFKS